jgi:putative ABC transport system ATP-binding protein
MTTLALRDVSVEYTTISGPLLALRELTLDVSSGQWVVIVGANGSGKTTLLNAICGDAPLARGVVEIDQHDVSGVARFERFRLIGRVYQNPQDGTAPTLSIFENLCLAARRARRPTLRRLTRRSLLGLSRDRLAAFNVGLEYRLDDPVSSLSGGLRQCVSVVMATLGDVRVLLLDEHVAALDVNTAARVLTGTQELIAATGLTTIMVVHDLDVAKNSGDRLVVLRSGSLALDIDNRDHHVTRQEIANAI